MARWWSKKYTLPPNHELFESQTLFDLYVEFYEDYYEQNPTEAKTDQHGNVVFQNTGDELIDKWERELAEGLTPNLAEATDSGEIAKLERLKQKHKDEINQIKYSAPVKLPKMFGENK